MEHTELGSTDLRVSRICFGTWQFGGDWSGFDRDRAVAAVRRARELGVDFFDTAQAYGFGQAERLLGEALADEIRDQRDRIVLATKGGLRMEEGELLRDASRDWLRQGLEESLEHLGTDHVDLYQVHWPDPETPFAETAATLQSFVDEGLVRAVGVSNFDVAQMEAFLAGGRLDALQPPYHMLRRDVEEDVLPWCREQGVGVFVYGPLAHGLLAGKYDEDTTFPAGDWRSGSDIFRGETFRRNLRAVERLREVATDVGCSLPQLAVAWTLARPGVDAAIVGARTPEQIEGTAPAAGVELAPSHLDRIDRILEDAVPVGGPTPEGV